MSFTVKGNKYTDTENRCSYLQQRTSLDDLLEKTIKAKIKG